MEEPEIKSKKKVIVIDDEKDLCLLIKDSLELQGKIEVTIVNDATSAEEVIRELKPDLILLDIVMPKRKGSDIAKALKKDPTTRKIPIIILSGLGEMVYFKEKGKGKWEWLPNQDIVLERGEVIKEYTEGRAAKAYGVEGYLEKPFWTETLVQVVNETLARNFDEE
jgi:CheY-like chemotaxis protein